MQTTENVLKVLSKRGEKQLPVERLHRQLYNISLYEKAYGQIYANRGATTRGVDDNTLDGTSKATFDKIIEKVKLGTYKWNPTRRTYIPKRNGKSRPLGIPTGNDKLLQTAMKILLEAYYDPKFSERSHGFRQGRGCHTALIQVRQKFKGTKWFIEGDIKGCFDNIDHKILMEILADDIKDNRFLKLIRNLLKAGYMRNWTTYETHSGTPQGGVISPLLANIYLHKFDQWVEKELLPRHNRSHNGKGRRVNLEYNRLRSKADRAERKGDTGTAIRVRKESKLLPSVMTDDPDYRSLEYIRYADDFILGFAGPKSEAKEIKEEIREYLKDSLNLELSQEKTLITHALTEKAKFLGYDLKIMHANSRRGVNGKLWFGIPREVINENVQKYAQRGRIMHRAYMINDSDYDIIRNYQAEYRGVVNYYCMAHNLRKISKVRQASQTSLLKTLAAKYKSSNKKMEKKYLSLKTVKGTTYKVLQVIVNRDKLGKKPLIAYYGAVPTKRIGSPAQITDNLWQRYGRRYEIIDRLNADKCEMCGTEGPVEMHHREPMKNVNKKGKNSLPAWEVRLIAMRRKTLAVCWTCHQAITYERHLPEWDKYKESLNHNMMVKTESAE